VVAFSVVVDMSCSFVGVLRRRLYTSRNVCPEHNFWYGRRNARERT
jgi:hypothetical protein